MVQIAVLQCVDEDRLQVWLRALAPTDAEVAGNVALVSVGQSLHRDREGRAAGQWSGVWFNDQALGE